MRLRATLERRKTRSRGVIAVAEMRQPPAVSLHQETKLLLFCAAQVDPVASPAWIIKILSLLVQRVAILYVCFSIVLVFLNCKNCMHSGKNYVIFGSCCFCEFYLSLPCKLFNIFRIIFMNFKVLTFDKKIDYLFLLIFSLNVLPFFCNL